MTSIHEIIQPSLTHLSHLNVSSLNPIVIFLALLVITSTSQLAVHYTNIFSNLTATNLPQQLIKILD